MRSGKCVFLFLVLILIYMPAMAQTELTHMAELPTAWQYVEGVQVQGNYAYVASGESGVRVLDISDPENPFEVSYIHTPDLIRELYVHGDYIYTIGNDLHTIDNSDPLNMELLSSSYIGRSPRDIHADGDILVVSVRSSQGTVPLLFLDISDRANPVLTASLDITTDWIRVQDNFLFYVSDNNFISMDISDLSDPQIVNTLITDYNLREFVVDGNYAYLSGTTGFVVVDISNPGSIFEAASIALPNGINNYFAAKENNRVYLSGLGHTVFDVSDPTDPQILGSITQNWDFYHMTVHNGTMMLSDFDTGIHFYDVSNPNNFSFESNYNRIARSIRSIIHGNLMIVDGTVENSVSATDLLIYSLEDPDNPELLSSTILSETRHSGVVYSMRAVGDILYLAGSINNLNGFFTLDISDPSNPEMLDYYSSYRWMEGGMQIRGNLAYVNCDVNGLQIFDISDPSFIQHVGDDPQGTEYAMEFALEGDYAVVYNSNMLYDRIRLLDISDPANVHNESVLEDSISTVSDIDIQDGLAFVASWDSPLKVVDISDPQDPELVTEFTDIIATNVRVADTLAWVAEFDGSLHVIDISDVYFPEILSTVELSGRPRDLEVNPETGIIVVNNSWFVNVLQMGETAVEDDKSLYLPALFSVTEMYPNPFNSSAQCQINLPKAGTVELSVYDILGREVHRSSEIYKAGLSKLMFNTQNLNNEMSTGVYFIRFAYNNQFRTQKVTYLK